MVYTCVQVAHCYQVTANYMQKCMVHGCEKEARSHGVCRTHYKMLLKMVRQGDTTWQELEANGITTPATFTRDPKDREMLTAYLAKMLKA